MPVLRMTTLPVEELMGRYVAPQHGFVNQIVMTRDLRGFILQIDAMRRCCSATSSGRSGERCSSSQG
jgi:hypothetical protein